MNKLFKTFWNDNKLIIGITIIVLLVISFILPASFLGVSKLNYSGAQLNDEVTFIFGMVSVLIFILSFSVLLPACAVFISLRTTKGSARLRYSQISTSRITFAFFSLITYIILSMIVMASISLGLILVALIYQVGISTIFEGIIDLTTWIGFDRVLILGVINNFASYLFSFYYWQLMFLLPHTKSFRKLPFIGMIFLIIGIYVFLQIISTIFGFFLLWNLDSPINDYSLIYNLLVLGIGAGAYHYFIAKEYEY